MIGKIISHYKIIEKIGEGGMGKLYKALDLKLERLVALKFLPADLSFDQQSKSRFLQEAKSASHLDHPNIGTVFDLGETHDGQLFITMAYYEGQTLEEILRHRQLEITEIIDIAYQIAQGLAATHSTGIVHRDIKPSNIIFTKDGTVKIVDFGVARMKDQTKQTGAGLTLGTVPYMSPEQTLGESTDHRTDIWSLGVIMYEMLTNRLPFKGDYDQAIIYSILKENPPAFKPAGNGVNLLKKIIWRALEKNPQKRYQNVTEMLTELGQIRTELHRQVLKQDILPIQKRLKKPLVFSTSLIILFILLSVFKFMSQPQNTEYRRTLAVLPFENLSLDSSNDYICEGFTEDLRLQLSKVSDLQVISRTSVMKYKSTPPTLKEIARELNAGTIIEGSIIPSEKQARIIVRLFDAQTEKQLWGGSYNSRMADIFKLPSSIAIKVAGTLKADIPPPVQARINTISTIDFTAYDYFLKGREYYFKDDPKSNRFAIESYKKAIAIDPDYALAYAGLAETYCRYIYPAKFDRYNAVWKDSALAACEKALSIDPEISEVHNAMGNIYNIMGWRQKALDAYNKAIQLNPSNHRALSRLSSLYSILGEYDKALTFALDAIKILPTDAEQYLEIADIYRGLKEYEIATDWCDRATDIAPDMFPYGANRWHLIQKTPEHARKIFKELLESDTKMEWVFHDQGLIYQNRFGFSEYAIAMLERAMELNDKNPWHYIGLANIHVELGELLEATSILKKSSDLFPFSTRLNLNYSFHLVRLGQIKQARQVANYYLENVPEGYWLEPIVKFYLGMIDESEFERQTKNIFVDIDGKREMSDESYFYFGMIYLYRTGPDFQFKGNTEKAGHYLEKMLKRAGFDDVEPPVVRAELRKLGVLAD